MSSKPDPIPPEGITRCLKQVQLGEEGAEERLLILVYNQDSYLMAEYSERTGRVSWQRVVPVTQREAIERWLNEQYPVRKAKAATTTAATNSK